MKTSSPQQALPTLPTAVASQPIPGQSPGSKPGAKPQSAPSWINLATSREGMSSPTKNTNATGGKQLTGQ